MVARELYLRAREVLYRGLLSADRFFYRPDVKARPRRGVPATIGLLIPVNAPEGSIGFSRAKQVGQALRGLGIETRFLRYRSTPEQVGELLRELEERPVDRVLIPGSFDLDQEGLPQLLLDVIGVPHTGSDGVAVRLCADKLRAKRLAAAVGVATPRGIAVTSPEVSLPAELSYPVIVKPRSGTSSFDVSVAHNETQLREAVGVVLANDRFALIEQKLAGKEVTVGVLGGAEPRALGVVGFGPGLLSTADKTSGGRLAHEEPANISEVQKRAVCAAALAAYEALGCAGYARIDLVLEGDEPHLLEVNAVPGLFPDGVFVACARLAGMSYEDLLTEILSDTQP